MINKVNNKTTTTTNNTNYNNHNCGGRPAWVGVAGPVGIRTGAAGHARPIIIIITINTVCIISSIKIIISGSTIIIKN